MIRESITAELERQGKTRYWLVRESGVPASTVYAFLAGTRGTSHANVEAMLSALGLSPQPDSTADRLGTSS